MVGTLFPKDDTLSNKLSYYHLVLLMASLPFDLFYSHLILISYAIHTLIHLKRQSFKQVFKLRTFVLQSVFFVTVVSTIYTVNTNAAFNEWGKQLTIILIPVLFCLNAIDIKKYREPLLLWFSLFSTATIIYLYADAFMTLKHYNLPYSFIFLGPFTNHNFSEPIGIHATFFSMQVALALVYLLSAVINAHSTYLRLFYLVCTCILLAGLIQLSSKSIFIALIVIINIALPYFLLKGAQLWRFIAISMSILLLIIAGILNSGNLRERYIAEMKQDLSKRPAGAITETTDSRLSRWNVSLELIKKSPVLGYGAGSEISLLHDQFYEKKLYNSFLNGLNTHSEYLSFLLKSGILGLLVYLSTLAFGFTISFRNKDIIFFCFMVLIAIVSISENFLDVDKGICFYAIFFSFFTFSTGKKMLVDETALISVKQEKLRVMETAG